MTDRVRIISSYIVALATLVGITVVLWMSGSAQPDPNAAGPEAYKSLVSTLMHLYYVPILIAALFLGEKGGVLFAVLATLATALLAWQVPSAQPPPPLTWLTIAIRGAFYIMLGYLAGWLSRSVRSGAREWQSLVEISHAINASLDLDETLQSITRQSVELTNADACAIRLIQEGNGEMVYAKTWGLSDRYVGKGPMMVRDSPLAQRALNGESDITIVDVRRNAELPYREAMLAEGILTVVSLPLRVEDRVIGLLNLYGKRAMGFNRRDRRVGRAFAEQAALAIQNARLFASVRTNYIDTVRALVRAIEARDAMTLAHSERVAELALKMACALDLSSRDLEALEFGAVLHDIGKIGLSEQTLSRGGRLSLDERVLMEMHPMIGKSIIDPIGFLAPSVPVVFSHHERWDGMGYPEGRAGVDIPLLARIVAVADGMEHLMHPGSTSVSLPADEAIAAMREEAGKRHDPDLVEVLARVIDEPACAYEVK